MRILPVLLALLLALAPAVSASAETFGRDRFIRTSDGVRLHLLEAGPANGHTIVFVPGWTMPGWIWDRQLRVFARRYHVVAFDPRGQGLSDAPAYGYDAARRGQDIAETMAQLGPMPAVVVAWSLGVLDTLAYVHAYGDSRLAGLVLVDNSVGEEPAPVFHPVPHRPGPVLPYPEQMRRFVHAMFRHKQSAAWLDQLTSASLRTPEPAAAALRRYSEPRSYWREAVYAARCPVLYVVRPAWEAQAENLARNRPRTEIALFRDAGHALFVDDAGRFNALLDGFLRTKAWP